MSSVTRVFERLLAVRQIEEDHTGSWVDVPTIRPLNKNDPENPQKTTTALLGETKEKLVKRKSLGQRRFPSAFSPYQNYVVDFISARDRNRELPEEKPIQEIAHEILQEMIQRMFQKMERGKQLFKVRGFPVKLERKKLFVTDVQQNQEIQEKIDQQSDLKDFKIAKIFLGLFREYLFVVHSDHVADWFLYTCKAYKHCQRGKAYIEIGKGAYGRVYSAKDGSTGIVKTFAIKRFNERYCFYTEWLHAQMITEAEIPHAISLIDFCSADTAILVYPYIPGGDLDAQIQKGKIFSFSEITLIVYQLSQTLTALAKRGIIHLDIKTQNLFFHEKELFVGDWGSSNIRSFQEEFDNVEQTQYIRAPEVLLGLQVDGKKIYTPSADIWSLGCVIFELLERKPAFITKCFVDERNIGSQKNLESIKEQFQLFEKMLPEDFFMFFIWLTTLGDQGKKVTSIFYKNLNDFTSFFCQQKAFTNVNISGGGLQAAIKKLQTLFEIEDRKKFISQRKIFEAIVRIWRRCWNLDPQMRLKIFQDFKLLDKEIALWRRREGHEILRVWQKFSVYRRSLTFKNQE